MRFRDTCQPLGSGPGERQKLVFVQPNGERDGDGYSSQISLEIKAQSNTPFVLPRCKTLCRVSLAISELMDKSAVFRARYNQPWLEFTYLHSIHAHRRSKGRRMSGMVLLLPLRKS